MPQIWARAGRIISKGRTYKEVISEHFISVFYITYSRNHGNSSTSSEMNSQPPKEQYELLRRMLDDTSTRVKPSLWFSTQLLSNTTLRLCFNNQIADLVLQQLSNVVCKTRTYRLNKNHLLNLCFNNQMADLILERCYVQNENISFE